VERASRIGLPALTLYGFSAESFTRRPATEIYFLMKLLHRYLKNELPLMGILTPSIRSSQMNKVQQNGPETVVSGPKIGCGGWI